MEFMLSKVKDGFSTKSRVAQSVKSCSFFNWKESYLMGVYWGNNECKFCLSIILLIYIMHNIVVFCEIMKTVDESRFMEIRSC